MKVYYAQRSCWAQSFSQGRMDLGLAVSQTLNQNYTEKDNLREQPLPECMLQWRWGIHRQKKWGTLFFGDNL